MDELILQLLQVVRNVVILGIPVRPQTLEIVLAQRLNENGTVVVYFSPVSSM